MIESKKDVEALRIWESVEVLNSLLTEIKASNSKLAAFVSSVQAILQQILKVKTFDVWIFTTDFVARLKSLDQAIGVLTESVRRFIASEVATDNELPELVSLLEGVIDEARRAGILDFKIKITNETEKVVSNYTAAVIAGLEKIKSQEDDFTLMIENLRSELSSLTGEISQDKSVIAEIQKSKDDFVAELKTSNKDFLNEETKKALALIAGKIEVAEAAVTKIQELETDAKTLADKVYQKTVSQEYGSYAIRQSIVGGIYSVLTIVAGIYTAKLNWQLAHDLQSNSDSISNFKIFSSLTSIGIFAFLAAETSGYRHQARDAKRTQLDLNSVDTAFAKGDILEGKNLRLEVIKSTFERPRPTVSRWTDGLFVRRSNKD